MNRYSFTDTGYFDEIGGYHDAPEGWNPKGHWCGECLASSCANCIYKDSDEDVLSRIVNDDTDKRTKVDVE